MGAKDEREVYFTPNFDITPFELARIMAATIMREPGSVDGVYSRLPEELKRHFSVVEAKK